MKKILSIALSLTLLACSSSDHSKREKFIDGIISQMTMEQKLGQMVIYSSGEDTTIPVFNPGFRQEIAEARCGAIFASISPDSIRALQSLAIEKTPHIPLLFGYDVIHGYKTIFPIPLAEAASWDMERMELSSRIAATEAASKGINWVFAPMVDVARDARWGRVAEGAGEDPYLGSLVAAARVKGFQGSDLSDVLTVAACPKHFIAYGAAEAGKDYNSVDISTQRLYDVYLPPFSAAVDAGAATVMSSFNEINGVPVTASESMLKSLLKTQMGFTGFVVSDFNAVRELINHGVATDAAQCATLAINAGVDMDMEGGIYKMENVGSAVTTKTIDDAVRRILRVKYDLGLFDDPFRYCNVEQNKLLTKEHLNAAREIAVRSMVLLKNENRILPLKEGVRSIALVGALAASRREPLGPWIAQGDSTDVTTVEEGLLAQLPATTKLNYVRGCDINSSNKAGFEQAKRVAAYSDVIVAVLGESASMSGEATSRTDIGLPGVQSELLRALYETGKPVVLVVMSGRPLALENELGMCSSLVQAWLPGTECGNAVADILLGKYNPSAKLPISFPRNVGQTPIYYASKNTGRPGNENDHTTSKYIDSRFTPLFPFGFGLSYTTFDYKGVEMDKTSLDKDQSITITAQVANSGECDGEEVVQLYIRDLLGSVTRPVRELKGFKKVAISRGESARVKFEIVPSRDLTFTNANAETICEAGEFEIFVGGDSNAQSFGKFTVK